MRIRLAHTGRAAAAVGLFPGLLLAAVLLFLSPGPGAALAQGRTAAADPAPSPVLSTPAVAPVASTADAKDGLSRGKPLGLRQLWDMARQRFPGGIAGRHAIRAAEHGRMEQIMLATPSGEISGFLSWTPPVTTRCARNVPLTTADGQPLMVNGQQVILPGGDTQCVATEGLTFNLNRDPITDYLPGPGSGALLRIDARLVQPIFTFGKLKAAIELGQVGVDLARANQEISQAELALNVLRTYYGLKTARAALDTIRDGHEQISTWIKRIDKDLEKGKGGYTEIDLVRLKMAETQVEMAELDVVRTIKSTLRALRYLVQDDQADVDEDDLQVADDERKELSYYIDTALLRRPELKILNATGKGAKLYRDLRIAELLPDLGLVLNFNYGLTQNVEDTGHAFMNRQNYVGAGLGLGMRMGLDFGPKALRLRKAIEDMRQFEFRRREALGGGAVEMERAYNDLQEAQKRLKAAETGERRARGWLQGIKQNIDVGTAESRDMIDALQAYFNYHLTVLRTINDVNTQAAFVRRLAGMDIIPPGR